MNKIRVCMCYVHVRLKTNLCALGKRNSQIMKWTDVKYPNGKCYNMRKMIFVSVKYSIFQIRNISIS